jgi:hypothetical protein
MYRHQGCGSDLYDAGPDLDPDTTFYFDADPDPNPTPSFKHVFYTIFLLYSQQCQFTSFYLSRQILRCPNSHYLEVY